MRQARPKRELIRTHHAALSQSEHTILLLSNQNTLYCSHPIRTHCTALIQSRNSVLLSSNQNTLYCYQPIRKQYLCSVLLQREVGRTSLWCLVVVCSVISEEPPAEPRSETHTHRKPQKRFQRQEQFPNPTSQSS